MTLGIHKETIMHISKNLFFSNRMTIRTTMDISQRYGALLIVILWMALPAAWGNSPTAAPYDVPRIAKITLHEPACHGLRGSIEIDSIMGGTAPFYFSLDGLNFSTNPIIKHVAAGEHVLYVKDANDGLSDTMLIMHEPEPLSLELIALRNPIKAGESVSMQAIVNPPQTILHEISWRPPQLIDQHFSLTQTLVFDETTNMNVKIKDVNGCQASAQVRILVDDRTVYVPNAFLPGSDQNAYFTVYTGGGVTNILSLKIYDRWGRPVFAKDNFLPNDPLLGWDGNIDNKTAPPGTYLYAAKIEYFDGKTELIKGDLMIAPAK